MIPPSDRRQRVCIFALLVAFALGVYMLSYRALIQSGDARRALDAVTSTARYGDWLMDETNWIKLPFRIRESSALPLGEYRVQERLNILLAGPLLRLADALPRLGGIHTVWLFNVIITALITGLIYLTLRELGYADAVAVLVALSACVATNLWAYSQTFFREPLAAFFILLALYALLRFRRYRPRVRALGVVVAAIAVFLAYETKHSAVFALPAIVVFALPERQIQRLPILRQALVATMALAALVIAIPMLLAPFPPMARSYLLRFGIETEQLAAALRAYILSPGASLWATSPLLLLAIPGGVMAWRRGRRSLVAGIVLLFAGYALGHALLTGAHWFGGLSWPPRFLLPALPVLMLATAPIAQAMFQARARLLRFLWLALLLYGFWIQFVGVSLSLERYSESLPPESNGFSEWEPSLLQPRYFRWALLPRRWGDLGFEFLWTRADLPVWGLSFALFTTLASAGLWQGLRQPGDRWRRLSPLLLLSCIPLVILNLMSAYDKDSRTRSRQGALHEALDYLAEAARADDVLLLSSRDYGDFILNHMGSAGPRPIILERPPAQAASDRQPALIKSMNPNDWFEVQSFRALRHIAGRLDRLWVLDNTSRYMPWSFRPLERYLTQHFYPLGEVELAIVDESARLLEFSTVNAAPNPLRQFAGDISSDLRYGERTRLVGFALPGGARYSPGDVVELSLLWAAEAALDKDYLVAAFIVDERRNTPIAQGNDSAPQAGFAPTSSWKPGAPVWDNRALRLPADAAAGDYHIWVLMYRHDDGAITRLPVSGASVTQDGTVGVLPIRLVIE